MPGEMNILRKEGVIDFKSLKYLLDRNYQLGSPETLLCELLEVDGVLEENIHFQFVHILNRLHHQHGFWIPMLWVLHQVSDQERRYTVSE